MGGGAQARRFGDDDRVLVGVRRDVVAALAPAAQVPAPALRAQGAQQAQEEVGAVQPAGGHDNHQELAEAIVRQDVGGEHPGAGDEGREGGDADRRAQSGGGEFDAPLAVVFVGRHQVGHGVVRGEVDGQAYGDRYRHRFQNVQLPAEQHQRGGGDDDDRADRRGREHRHDEVARRQQDDAQRHDQGNAHRRHRAVKKAFLQRVVVQVAYKPRVASVDRRVAQQRLQEFVRFFVKVTDVLERACVTLFALKFDDHRAKVVARIVSVKKQTLLT